MRSYSYPTRKVRKHTIYGKIEGVMVEKLNWFQRLCNWFFIGDDARTYRFGMNSKTGETIWFEGLPPSGTYDVYYPNGVTLTTSV